MKNKKINILFVISSLTGGGAELVVTNLCRSLDKKRYNVFVCCLKTIGERGEELKNEGYPVFNLKKYKLKIFNYFSFFQLRKIVIENDIHILHSHNTDAFFESASCKIFTSNLKFVHSFHFGNYPYHKGLYVFLENIFWRFADTLIAVGIEQRKAIQSLYKIPDSKIITIWNGIRVQEHTINPNNKENSRVLIGSISVLSEQKGLFNLLKIAKIIKDKKLNNFIFKIVGDGPFRKALEEKCKELEVEDVVEFTGWIHNAATNVLPNIDIFFQSSLWEAMSMVVLEAMAAAKPVVVTNVGDNSHVVKNEFNGFVREKDDLEGLAQALIQLIENVELRNTFGKNSFELFSKIGKVETMTINHEKLYSQLV